MATTRATSVTKRTVLTILLLSLFSFNPTPSAREFKDKTEQTRRKIAPVCTDFLEKLNKKPVHLTFVACEPINDRQGKPLRAAYIVSGKHAASVELALSKSIGLNKLKRSCCQWDSQPTSFL
jgi:hypothetical protein